MLTLSLRTKPGTGHRPRTGMLAPNDTGSLLRTQEERRGTPQ